MKHFFVFLSLLILSIAACSNQSIPLTAPSLTNNPSQDVIVTNPKPLFSFFNAKGGNGNRTYEIEIDTTPTFDSKNIVKVKDIPEENKYISSKLIDHKSINFQDGKRYYWRARAIDSKGNYGPWSSSRFYFDSKADDTFMNLVRVSVEDIQVSSGYNKKNIIDLDDPGQSTFWQSTPPGSDNQWVYFDLGRTKSISRVWMLSNPNNPDGWLKDFVWQSSHDGRTWRDISGTEITNNDTFRNIINFAPVSTRYLRLFIKDWHGYAAQINAITIYSPGKPPVPEAPEGNYVLVVGDQQNGYTFTELAQFVEGLDLGLQTLTVPHYEISLEMVNNLKNKPVAIILSGNNANYPNLPMYEYNGVYELIRESDIPILGICCGHQQLAMAYGYTYARSMGWDDISAMDKLKTMTEIQIVKDDPIFKDMSNPFVAVEIHGWAVADTAGVYDVLAKSTYIQSMKNKTKDIYGEQFHAEIKVPYNQGTPYLVNFLKMALDKKK